MVEWRHDFRAAVAEAKATGKALFVVTHRVGEVGCESMVKPVYRHRRFARAVRAFVPIVICDFSRATAAAAVERFGFPDPATLLRTRSDAHRALFGPNTTVPAPQHLVFHPGRGVLWHSTYTCSLSQVLNGMAAAKRELRKKPKQRLSRVRSLASQLAKRARSNQDAFFRLCTLVRHTSEAQFQVAIRVIRKVGSVCRRLLQHLTATLAAADAETRLRAAAPIVGDTLVAPFLERVRRSPSGAVTPSGTGPRDQRPLKSLGRLPAVQGSKLPMDVAKSLRGETGQVTVLWFYDPNDPTLAKQRAAIAGEVEKLRKRGVRFVGLACHVELPEKSSEREFGFECYSYRFRRQSALGGVTWFPSAVVLDAKGDVAFRSRQASDGMAKSYTEFASIARRLLASGDR